MIRGIKYYIKSYLYYWACRMPFSSKYKWSPKRFSELTEAPIGTFSVIIPTYNRSKLVFEAIDSVLNQSYTNYEIIVADDGSTDATKELLSVKYDGYLKSGKIKYLGLPHGGVSRARNEALRISKGTWVAYLDSDNIWSPSFLMIMSNYLDGSSSAYCAMHVDNQVDALVFDLFEPEFDWDKLLSKNFIDMNSYVHSKELFIELGGFDENLSRLVDWDLILRYSKKHKPVAVPVVLVNYKIRKSIKHITTTESFDENYLLIRSKWE